MEKGGGTETLYIVMDYPRFFRREATHTENFRFFTMRRFAPQESWVVVHYI